MNSVPSRKNWAVATKIVTVIACSVGLIFFLLSAVLVGVNLAESLIFAMGMVVAFVPEGMLPLVTLSLAMGTQRMASRHALIKRLSAVETLGCTTVICTDKTGTLTQNEMTVRDLWFSHRSVTVTGAGYTPTGQVLEDGQPVALDTDLHQPACCRESLPPTWTRSSWTNRTPSSGPRPSCSWSCRATSTGCNCMKAGSRCSTSTSWSTRLRGSTSARCP